MASPRVFRILYNTLYYALYLILLGVLIVSPADLMRQALMHHNNTNILIIAASYLVTILVLAFVYATRLYINRSVLAGIPKGWIPVEKGDGVPRGVREVICEGLSRSAAIAWGARPRVEDLIGGEGREKAEGGGAAVVNIGVVPSGRPLVVWGEIEHPGWASPTSPDLPNLQYEAVISELPNLIEAKALTLAPPDVGSRTDPPMLDADAVAVLTRPETMGLREYLVHLTEMGVLTPTVVGGFIAAYERARFSTRPVGNGEFRGLMHLFAEILRGMHALDPAVLGEEEEDGEYESDIDEDAPRESSLSSGVEDTGSVRTERRVGRGGGGSGDDNNDDDDDDAQRNNTADDNFNNNYNDDNNNLVRLPTSSTTSSLSSSHRHYSSERLGPTGMEGRNTPSMMRNSSANTWQQSQFRTAPTTPKSRRTMRTRRSSSGTDSFVQTRHPCVLGSSEEEEDGEGSGSVRSGESGGSVVIRLASGEEESIGGLPYVLGRAVTT